MALHISAKQAGTILGIKGQTVIRLEQRGYLTDVSGRTGQHHHYYAQAEVRALQKVYAAGLPDTTLRARLAQNATNAPSAHAEDRPSKKYGHGLSETATWLTAYLTAQGGTARVSELLRDAHTAGHSQDACYSARNHVGIFSVARRTELGMGSLRGWSLPVGDLHVEAPAETGPPPAPEGYVGWGVGRRRPRGRPRKSPKWEDAIHNVDIPPTAVTPLVGQQRHDGMMTQIADLHVKLDRRMFVLAEVHAKLDQLLNIWK